MTSTKPVRVSTIFFTGLLLGNTMKTRRIDAILSKDNFYFTGKPCKYGHRSKRNTVDGSCYECRMENQRKARAEIRTKSG